MSTHPLIDLIFQCLSEQKTAVDQQREIIKEFMQKTMTDYDLGRVDGAESMGVGDTDDPNDAAEELWKYGCQLIDQLEPKDVLFLTLLMEWIKQGKVQNMDKESMVACVTDGFCFNKNVKYGHKGKLVIFNER